MKISEYIQYCIHIMEEEGDMEVCYPSTVWMLQEIDDFHRHSAHLQDFQLPVRAAPEVSSDGKKIIL